MFSRILVARGISCLTTSSQIVRSGVSRSLFRPIRLFSETTESATNEVNDTTKTTEIPVSPTEPAPTPIEPAPASEAPVTPAQPESTPEAAKDAKNEGIDKELLQNLLSSITEEVKSEKEQKQLVYDFTTIMMDPDFKQLFLSLNDALPANYFSKNGLLPVVKKEFIARLQEEMIKGSFRPIAKDTSLLGLREKRADMTKDNTVIQTAENAADTLLYPLPSWIVDELHKETAKSSTEVTSETATSETASETVTPETPTSETPTPEKTTPEKTTPTKAKRVTYDPNRNNAMEEQLDTFGDWPFRNPTATPTAPVEPKKQRKNVIVNKKGVRIAYGGGKRKDAVARAFVRAGTGVIRVNGKSLIDAFPMGNNRDQVLAPLAVTLAFQKFDVEATVNGGGTTGQSEAVRMAVAKALAHYDPVYSVALSKAGLLTADPRRVERKKPGHTKARKPQQWVKR
ncbi:hypothetical protein WA577_007003 [Blastocystis sp. JDR]